VSVHNLIFDFDGVLADTLEASVMAVSTIDGTSPEETREIILRFFDTPSHDRKRSRSAEWLAEKLAWNTRYAEEMVRQEFALFDDFLEEIRQLPGARLAVVSSGMGTYIIPKLKETGLPFSHILCFEDSHSKEEKVERICADWGIGPREAYYVTDTRSDVIELRELLDPAKIIGCAWGFHGHETLAQVLPPGQILREFSDLRRILR